MRRIRALVTALVLALSLALVGAPEAVAARPGGGRSTPAAHVALGDSFAAGAARTPSSDPGATIDSLLASQLPREPVDAVRDVTVTIGGNDVGFADVLSDCVDSMVTDGCSSARKAATEAAVDHLGGDLDTLLARIRGSYPSAVIHLTGYPKLFGPVSGRCVVGRASLFGQLWINQGDADWLNDVTLALNARLAAAAADHGARYVDVTESFAGHGRCDTGTPWVNGLVLDGLIPLEASDQSFHPTAAGQAAYAASFSLQS